MATPHTHAPNTLTQEEEHREVCSTKLFPSQQRHQVRHGRKQLACKHVTGVKGLGETGRCAHFVRFRKWPNNESLESVSTNEAGIVLSRAYSQIFLHLCPLPLAECFNEMYTGVFCSDVSMQAKWHSAYVSVVMIACAPS